MACFVDDIDLPKIADIKAAIYPVIVDKVDIRAFKAGIIALNMGVNAVARLDLIWLRLFANAVFVINVAPRFCPSAMIPRLTRGKISEKMVNDLINLPIPMLARPIPDDAFLDDELSPNNLAVNDTKRFPAFFSP